MIKKVAIVTGSTRGIGFGISQQIPVDKYDLNYGV